MPRTSPKNQPQPIDPAEVFDNGGDGTPPASDQPGDAAPSDPIDFDKLRADLAAKAAASNADAGYTGDAARDFANAASGGEVGDGFFMDLSKADEAIALIALGTRAIVSVQRAEAVLAASGNPMIKLGLKTEKITDRPAGVREDDTAFWRNRSIRDNVLFIAPNPITGKAGTLWRAKQVFDAFGVPWADRNFRSKREFMDWLEEIAPAFIGAVAEAVIGIERSSGADASGKAYPDRNTITNYSAYTATPHGSGPIAPAAAALGDDDGDDIPF
jgi:hypothetical protein